jgi:hypothetical protein
MSIQISYGKIYRPDVRVYPADAFLPGRPLVKNASARTSSLSLPPSLALPQCGRADASVRTKLPPPLPPLLACSLPPASLPSLASARTGCIRTDPCGRSVGARDFYFIFIFIYFGLLLPAGKERKKMFGFWFSIPKIPKASRAKRREDRGFFGLVPLVTHPSSIPLLGG